MLEAFAKSVKNPAQLSPLVLAFVGDAVFTLLVKSRLVCNHNARVGALHNAAAQQVNAAAQAKAYRRIAPILTEQEADVFRRGRNARVGSVPKHASVADYHHATGLEALFGYLYLSENMERILELFHIMQQEGEC